MTNDKQLLSVWKENLLAELKQSLHWEAIDSEDMNQVDFFELQPTDDNFPSRWLRQLMDNPAVQSEISPVPSLALKIKHLYYESRIARRERKTNPLGFGYPLLIQRDAVDANKYMAAPLFIWELNIKQNLDNPGDWIIEREANAPIHANRLLLYYLKKEYQLDLERLVQEALADNQVSQLELLKISNAITSRLGYESNISTINVSAHPTADELQTLLANGGGMQWSGTVGLFEPHTIQTLNVFDAELNWTATPALSSGGEPLNNTAETERKTSSKPVMPFRQYDFSIMPLDPYQAAVVRALDHEKEIAVLGGNGTGKTETIAALATNLVANKKKVLIVSNKLNGLQTILNRSDKAGFGELTLMVSNPHAEKETLLEAIYQNSLGAKKMPQYEEEELQHILNKHARLGAKLDNAHRAFRKPVFDKAVWAEQVGAFFDNQLQEGKHLLNNHLDAQQYEFSKREYDDLKIKIEQAYDLYNDLNTLKHPLRVLNTRIFTDKTHSEASAFTFDTVDSILNDLAELYNKFVVYLENYSDELNHHFDEYYQDLKEKIDNVKADISDYSRQYGEDFNKRGFLRELRMKAFSVFSKRLANVLKIKDEVRQSYNDIEGSYENRRYFAYLFPKSNSGSFEKLNKNLDDFEATMKEWKISTPNIIQQEIERLDKEHINASVDFKAKLAELDADFASFVARLNGLQLYQKQFHSDANTLIKKRKFLEEVTEMMETLQYNLRDFDAYYYWTSFWLGLNEKEQVLIKALTITKPNKWTSAFNSWYFHHTLTNNFDANLLEDSSIFEEYAAQYEKLKGFIPKRALKYWKVKQIDEIRGLKRDNKYMHMILFAKNRTRFVHEFNVRSLFNESFDLLTNMFPIMLATPAVVSEWLPQHKGFFDVVIIDNANEIQTEEALGALWRGKKNVVVGDDLQVGNTMSASLMTYAKQSGYNRYYLPFHHGETEPHIWRFKNAAFYNNALKRLPNKQENTENVLAIQKIDGVYLESRTNEEEAQQVIHALNEIEANIYGKFPNVGIVCMTKEQRNLLIYYLDLIKQRRIAGNERIMALEQSGLSVHYYQEIQNHKFETLIVSTVFGANAKHEFSEDILTINKVEGLQGLVDLVAAFGKKTQIITSIPQTYLDHYAKYNSRAKGVHILSNLIEYGEALAENNLSKQDEICGRLVNESTPASLETPPFIGSFIEKVGENLAPFLEKGRLSINQTVNGLSIDLLLSPIHPGQPSLAIMSDGAFWRFPKGSHSWEKELEQQLKNANIDYLPIWSVNWWKTPDEATKQLAGAIIRFDQKYLPKPPAILAPANTAVEQVTEVDNAALASAATHDVEISFLDGEKITVKVGDDEK